MNLYRLSENQGSGKSTLMNIIGALDRPVTEGTYFLDGENIGDMNDTAFKQNKKSENRFCIPELYYSFHEHQPSKM